MQIPEIIYTGKGKDKHIAITDELRQYLKDHCREKKIQLAKELNISRPTLDRLFSECGIAKRETKKSKAVRRLAETLQTQIEHCEKEEKKRIIKQTARIEAKKNILDRMQESVKGKDGQPINYNGELLSTEGMVDISLINQSKDNPQANLALRAQVMQAKSQQKRRQEETARKRMMERISKQKDKRVSDMRKRMTDKGIYLEVLDTLLETWGDTWELKEIAKWNWKQGGGYTSDEQITAQAQTNDRPNQLYETYCKALKTYNDTDQKLRSACSAYYKLAVGDADEVTEADKVLASMNEKMSAFNDKIGK